MPTSRGGRHEHGQNFLTDHTIIDQIVDLVAASTGPIIEIGPGRGALTFPLQQLARPLTAIEIDARNASWLQKRSNGNTTVINDDFLQWHMPTTEHTVVGNVPFHLTTAILRRVLHAADWTHAVLLVQWEVARRRAGIGGATMMTAQWWPWVDFRLETRVPATAFTPRPNVDGGLLVMSRRPEPLVCANDQSMYRRFVHAVFTGKGHGLAAIVNRLIPPGRRQRRNHWLADEGIHPRALPKDLTAQQWAKLFRTALEHGWSAGPARK